MNLLFFSTTNGAWRTWKNCKAIQCVIAPFQAKVRKTGNTVTSAPFLRRLNASRRYFLRREIDYSSRGHPFFWSGID